MGIGLSATMVALLLTALLNGTQGDLGNRIVLRIESAIGGRPLLSPVNQFERLPNSVPSGVGIGRLTKDVDRLALIHETINIQLVKRQREGGVDVPKLRARKFRGEPSRAPAISDWRCEWIFAKRCDGPRSIVVSGRRPGVLKSYLNVGFLAGAHIPDIYRRRVNRGDQLFARSLRALNGGIGGFSGSSDQISGVRGFVFHRFGKISGGIGDLSGVEAPALHFCELAVHRIPLEERRAKLTQADEDQGRSDHRQSGCPIRYPLVVIGLLGLVI